MEGKAGGDTLLIQDTSVDGNVDMDGGKGDDSLQILCNDNTDGGIGIKSLVSQVAACTVNGKVEMDGGSGDNSYTITDYTITGKTEIEGESGIDTVNISGSTLKSLETDTRQGRRTRFQSLPQPSAAKRILIPAPAATP